MLVVGGFNSSNTISLAALCAERVPTYHVDDPSGIDVGRGTIRHMTTDSHEVVERADWLPAGPLRVGLTAGASTPNNKIGEAVARILAMRGLAAAPGAV